MTDDTVALVQIYVAIHAPRGVSDADSAAITKAVADAEDVVTHAFRERGIEVLDVTETLDVVESWRQVGDRP